MPRQSEDKREEEEKKEDEEAGAEEAGAAASLTQASVQARAQPSTDPPHGYSAIERHALLPSPSPQEEVLRAEAASTPPAAASTPPATASTPTAQRKGIHPREKGGTDGGEGWEGGNDAGIL